MKHRYSPYDARSEGERLRNQARLGTRWQERPLTHEERLALVLQPRLTRAWWAGFWHGWLWFAKWMLLLTCGLALTACMDVAQWQLRTFYGLDCRQEKLVDGKCVPVKAPKGASDVHTAQP
jgi:hypothetical protein